MAGRLYKVRFFGQLFTGQQRRCLWGINGISSGTSGDGDAGGFSTGDESNTDLEDAYVGFKSGDLLPFLGHNGVDVSFGSQNFAIGDGFLINGDSLNLGEGLNGAVSILIAAEPTGWPQEKPSTKRLWHGLAVTQDCAQICSGLSQIIKLRQIPS